MSYALAGPLQAAVYQQLTGETLVTDLVGTAIYDALPLGELPSLYVEIGPEDVRDRSDKTGVGAEHKFRVSVVSHESGFARAKALAGAITDVLAEADLVLSRGRLVGMWFDRAVARRGGKAGRARRIDMSFRARVEDN
ncbi:MAG: DUF3168 domain-containing protein [Sedimentitalea sp.]